MENHLHIPHVKELIIFLICAALFVPAFQRMKISSTVGFLLIGICVGPYGLGLFADQLPFLKFFIIEDVEGVKVLAEFGIMFLLFTIGLELTGERLWGMRRLIFGLGSSQVLLCGSLIALCLWSVGYSSNISVVLGACFALSSTAVVVQLLIEKGQFSSTLGRTSFSILLFQDLAVVPILLLLSILGTGNQENLGVSLITAAATAVAVMSFIFVLGRIVLRPLFRMVTISHSPEFFMAMTLLTVIGTSLATATAGLSMALGAFLAGLLIAETEFRHQIEIDIEPFKGLLMGLFFMSVGMVIDLRVVADNIALITLGLICLFIIKTSATSVLAYCFKIPMHIALATGMILAQGGEFAFVVIAMAKTMNILTGEIGQCAIIIAGLSMILTPFKVQGALLIKDYFSPEIRQDHPYQITEPDQDLEGHVIIAGFGRVGQVVAKMLNAQQTRYVAVDRNGPRVINMRNEGHPVLFGNSTRKEVLKALGADKAVAVVITVDEMHSAAQTIKNCKEEWPKLPVYVRVHDQSYAEYMTAIGARQVVAETSESSLRLAGFVLHELGVPLEAVHSLSEKLRNEHLQDLEKIELPEVQDLLKTTRDALQKTDQNITHKNTPQGASPDASPVKKVM